MEYKTEQEFLKSYNPDEYDRMAVVNDILLLSISNVEKENYRKLDEKCFSILLVKRDTFPFKDKWCLPGGFLNVKLGLEENARDILARETNLHNIFLEQLYTFGAVNRDPRMRVVSTAYMALIDKNQLKEQLNKNAEWFNIKMQETGDLITVQLNSSKQDLNFVVQKILKESTTDKYEYKIVENDYLAFDHPEIIIAGIDRFRNKILYTDIVFNIMPPIFTLSELQQVFEIALNKKLLVTAFRRIVADKVVKTKQLQTGGGHRPSVMYKYEKS